MRTLKLTFAFFSALLTLSAAGLLLNRILVTVNGGHTADLDFWILVGCLGFAAHSLAAAVNLIQERTK